MTQSPPARPGPLVGLRVLDLTRLLPGDFATWILADLGAEVIKVEDTGRGDYMRWMEPMAGHSSAMYNSINRGKRCIQLDLKQPAAREVFLRLSRGADAVVEGFRPGVMDRLGIGYTTLSAANPSLVYCAITGYGQDGPFAQRAGHDAGYIALAGLQGVTGTADGELALPGFQVADLGGGGMGGALAIVSALLGRERDPDRRGSFLDVSMFDVVSAFIAPHAARRRAGGDEGMPGGMHLNGRFPCYRLYRAADGRWMSLAALEPQFWQAFCDLVERPDLVVRQFEDGPGAIGEVAALFARRSAAEWADLATGHDVCLEPVLSLDEAMDHPQALARGLWLKGEALAQPAPVVRIPGVPPAPNHVAAPGEDTEAILVEAGYTAGEVVALREAGAAL